VLDRRALATATVGVILVLAGAVLVLSQRAPRLAGTNSIRPAGYVATVAPGKRLCQPVEVVPADARAVRLFVGVYGRPGPPFDISVADSRGLVTAGSASSGYGDGDLRVPVRSVASARTGATICLRNRGATRLALAGVGGAGPGLTLGRQQVIAMIKVEWLRPGRESWWDLAAVVAHRFGIGKADFLGDWALWATLALLACAWIVALGCVVIRR
jgi:hypothetical protein